MISNRLKHYLPSLGRTLSPTPYTLETSVVIFLVLNRSYPIWLRAPRNQHRSVESPWKYRLYLGFYWVLEGRGFVCEGV